MFVNKLLEIIFPRKCAFCNIIINKDYACKKCKKKLEYMCINYVHEEVKKHEFENLICAYPYIGMIREKLLEFKFKNKKFLYRALSEKLIIDIKKISIQKFDYIIPVPISFNRYLERGYNQSYLIAKFISKELNKPLIKFGLVKVKNNRKQSLLSMAERAQNVKGVYRVLNSRLIDGKNILLIDDIFTTGTTVEECSKVLKNNGAQRIIVATVAKAENKSNKTKEDVKWTN